jgi:hypothetical protein
VITEANALLKMGKKVTYQQYRDAVLALYDPTCETYNPNMEANYSEGDMTYLLDIIKTSGDAQTIALTTAGTLTKVSLISGNYPTAILVYIYGKSQHGSLGTLFAESVDQYIASHQP